MEREQFIWPEKDIRAASLLSLDPLVLAQVASHLRPKDAASLSATCSYLKKLFSEGPWALFVWRNYAYRTLGHVSCSLLEASLPGTVAAQTWRNVVRDAHELRAIRWWREGSSKLQAGVDVPALDLQPLDMRRLGRLAERAADDAASAPSPFSSEALVKSTLWSYSAGTLALTSSLARAGHVCVELAPVCSSNRAAGGQASAQPAQRGGRLLVTGGMLRDCRAAPHPLVIHADTCRVSLPELTPAAGPPPTPRMHHTATCVQPAHSSPLAAALGQEAGLTQEQLAASHCVLMLGGCEGEGTLLGCEVAELLLLDAQCARMQWVTLPTRGPAPCPRSHHTACTFDKGARVVVYGGSIRGADGGIEDAPSQVHVLQLDTLTWTAHDTRPPPSLPCGCDPLVPAPRLAAGSSAFALPAAAHAAGSLTTSCAASTSLSGGSQPSAQPRVLQHLPLQRTLHAAVVRTVLGSGREELVLLGGRANGEAQPMVPLALDLQDGAFTWRMPSAYMRCACGAAGGPHEGPACAGGSSSGGTSISSSSTAPHLPPPRLRAGTWTVGDTWLVLLGGHDHRRGSQFLDDAQRLHLPTLCWYTPPRMLGSPPWLTARAAGLSAVSGVAFGGCISSVMGLMPVVRMDVMLPAAAAAAPAHAAASSSSAAVGVSSSGASSHTASHYPMPYAMAERGRYASATPLLNSEAYMMRPPPLSHAAAPASITHAPSPTLTVTPAPAPDHRSAMDAAQDAGTYSPPLGVWPTGALASISHSRVKLSGALVGGSSSTLCSSAGPEPVATGLNAEAALGRYASVRPPPRVQQPMRPCDPLLATTSHLSLSTFGADSAAPTPGVGMCSAPVSLTAAFGLERLDAPADIAPRLEQLTDMHDTDVPFEAASAAARCSSTARKQASAAGVCLQQCYQEVTDVAAAAKRLVSAAGAGQSRVSRSKGEDADEGEGEDSSHACAGTRPQKLVDSSAVPEACGAGQDAWASSTPMLSAHHSCVGAAHTCNSTSCSDGMSRTAGAAVTAFGAPDLPAPTSWPVLTAFSLLLAVAVVALALATAEWAGIMAPAAWGWMLCGLPSLMLLVALACMMMRAARQAA